MSGLGSGKEPRLAGRSVPGGFHAASPWEAGPLPSHLSLLGGRVAAKLGEACCSPQVQQLAPALSGQASSFLCNLKCQLSHSFDLSMSALVMLLGVRQK